MGGALGATFFIGGPRPPWPPVEPPLVDAVGCITRCSVDRLINLSIKLTMVVVGHVVLCALEDRHNQDFLFVALAVSSFRPSEPELSNSPDGTTVTTII